MSERTCSVDGCERPFYGRDLCQLHYNRVRKHGSVNATRKRRQPAPCVIDGCDGVTNVPGTARGWCSSHYYRWQRWGDPLGSYQPVIGIAECAVDGCTDLVNARGWCVKHYTRWERSGDPKARLRGEVRNGRRICPGCKEDKQLSEYGRSRRYCKPCEAAKTAAYRKTHPYVPAADSPAECDCCGQAFLANKRRWRYCSRDCFLAYKNRANWKHYQARRARLREAHVETFDRTEIFDRDGWVCQICREPIDPGARFPDPKSVSLDHIIPIARGGKHERTNAQTACLGCNVRKGARIAA